MADIKASNVQKLRKVTGAGMMDCKKALQESGGDFDKAIEIIRKKGQAVASKRADREAGEGVALALVNDSGTMGALLTLNCETDFVAKNEDFVKLAESILNLALREEIADLAALKKARLNGKDVESVITDHIGIIGEKLELSAYDKINAPQVVAYIHPGNKLATLVGFNKNADTQVGKDLAMQVAAMNPIAVDKDSIPQEIVDQEIEIGKEQARRDGKPEELLEKIAMGKLNKFFKENTLLNQDFVKDSKKTISQYLKEQDKELTVVDFKRFSLRD